MSENHNPILYDKSKWTRGEWDNESDRVDFIHAGFSCFIQPVAKQKRGMMTPVDGGTVEATDEEIARDWKLRGL